MSNHFTIWRDTPAECFTDALPLGNGRIGAMVHGRVAHELVQLNDDTLWSGIPRTYTVPQAPEALKEVRHALLVEQDWEKASVLCKKLQGTHTEKYQPLGNLHVEFALNEADVTDYRHELSLADAQTTTTFKLAGTTIRRDVFCSYPDQVLVMRLTAENGTLPDVSIFLDSLLPATTTTTKHTLALTGYAPTHVSHENAIQWDPENCIHFAATVAVKSSSGTVSVQENQRLIVQNATSATLILATATSFNGFAKHPVTNGKAPLNLATKTMNKAKKRSYDDLLSRHRADFVPLFNACTLDLGQSQNDALPTETRLTQFDGTNDIPLAALLFNFGRYLMLACSRAASQPANLQGIWNELICPPWSSNYTININTEMNYWANGPANLLDCDEPLVHMLDDLRKSGSLIASVNYNCRGWCAHHNTDLWRLACPVGDFGHGDPRWANWCMGGIWLCMNLWEHFAFSFDVDFLKRKAWPILKGAAQFALDWLVEQQRDGETFLVTAPSTSPENVYRAPSGASVAVSIATTIDMSLVKELFANCITAARILNLEHDATIKAIKRATPKLLPFLVGKQGQLQEWSYDWENEPEPHHRHISHCVSFFPGRLITVQDTPDLANAVKKTMEMRGDESTGWSLAWKTCVQARLLDGNHAWQLIRLLLRLVKPNTKTQMTGGGGVYANLFDAHPPFQIDGNFGITAAMAEMLIQSHRFAIADNDEFPRHLISILPALPDTWKQGNACGLRARGGFIFDLEWQDNKLKQAVLRSKRDTVCLIETATPLTVTSGDETIETTFEQGILSFKTATNRDYVITPEL